MLALVILVGLIVIVAWVRSALKRETPPPPVKTAPRLEIVPPPSRRPGRAAPTVLGYVALAEGDDLDRAAHGIGIWCEARGWPLAKVVHDALPARGTARDSSMRSTRSAPAVPRAWSWSGCAT